MDTQKFPDGFLWGAATAAHQVEGGNENNDWWAWEQTPGHIKHGDRSIVACDWWRGERYREDFDLARALDHNAHRLSVEWSRIEPREGEWDARAIAFYRRVLSALRERAMTPLVTLHHFTHPLWLRAHGAWETETVVPRFERFVTRIIQELGDLCDFWVTINEPMVYTYTGYVNAKWPPGKSDFGLAMRVLTNLLRGHAAAYHAIHRVQPRARVGLAHNLLALKPANPGSALNRAIAHLQDYAYNRVFLLALQDGRLRFPMGLGRVPEAIGTQDFIGLNFYFARRVAVDWTQPGAFFGRILPAQPWGVPYDDELLEWFGKGDIDPASFYRMVKWLAEYGKGKPIYICENGIPDRYDELRPRYLVAYLTALRRAIREGAPVQGYFHWTLVDNFEWIEGYSLRFGLIAHDLATQTRTPKSSAALYARIARENGITEEWNTNCANVSSRSAS
jgi:beta-glucosidase